MGPADQETVERRLDVLVYTAAPAGGEQLFLGDALVELFVQTTTPVSQWLARLCVVLADGTSTNVAEAVTRTRTTAGEIGRVRLSLGSIALRVGPDERLRLHVTNGSSPRWAGPADAESSVCGAVLHHDPQHPSSLSLPLLP
jgi:predicted acyl esterase